MRQDLRRRPRTPSQTATGLRQAPSDEAREAQRLRNVLDTGVAYEAMYHKIRAATRTLEAHRAEFDALMEDTADASQRACRLFSEEPFSPMRFTAEDVHRAFEAVGYPPRYRQELLDEDVETIHAAILYLADENQRAHLARQLLVLLPQFVSAGRYLDAWLIQYSAFEIVEDPHQSGPFLFTMFNHGFTAWASQVDNQQEVLLHEMGVDQSAIAGKRIDEVETWLQAQMADPQKKARVEAFFAANPAMSDQVEAELRELERGTLGLLERDDARCLFLSPEEAAPWTPVLMERMRPVIEQVRRVGKRDKVDLSDIPQAAGNVLVEVGSEMAPAIFTPERLSRLVTAVKDYRQRLLDAQEKEAVMYANAAVLILEHGDAPVENPLLIALCIASLRAAMVAMGEHGVAEATSRTERKVGDTPLGSAEVR